MILTRGNVKRDYRIRGCCDATKQVHHFLVEMWAGYRWITIKAFQDEDMSFAKREAEELFDKLNEK